MFQELKQIIILTSFLFSFAYLILEKMVIGKYAFGINSPWEKWPLKIMGLEKMVLEKSGLGKNDP